MSVHIPDFYAPLPQFGVPLNMQWDKFRTDFSWLNALMRNSYIDESTNLTTHVLNALAYGELLQRFKFRWRYDASTDEFQLQQNTTDNEANPTWTTIIKIRESDGRVTITGTGGLLVTGGFYNFGGLDVAVTQAGGAAFRDVGTVLFDSGSGFYITPDSSGRPIVSVNAAAASGTITDGMNQGTGAQVFQNKTASQLNFRTLTAGTNVSINQNTNDITISASDTGEVNTASNLGAGFGIWFDKQGVDLRFKSLVGGQGVNLSADNNTITIAAPEFYLEVKESEAGGYRKRGDKLAFDSTNFYVSTGGDGAPLVSLGASNDTASNLGAGAGVFAQKVGADFQFKSLVAGPGTLISSTASDVTISAPEFYIEVSETEAGGYRRRSDKLAFDSSYFYVESGGSGIPTVSMAATVDTYSSLGGTSILGSKVGNVFQFKGLTAGNNVQLTDLGSSLSVEALAGFYPGVIFRESAGSGYKTRDDELVVDSNYFYLTNDNRMKPFLSLVEPGRWSLMPETTQGPGYTIGLADRGKCIRFNAAVPSTFNLPAVATVEPGFTFQVRHDGNGTLTLDPAGAELINGSATTSVPRLSTTRVWCTGTAWRSVTSRATTRETLSGARTFFVRTDGSDSNEGLTNTAAGAFLTIQAAINACYAIDQNGFAITIQVAAGTYTGAVLIDKRFTGTVTILGDVTTPSNVVISTTDAQGLECSNPGCFIQVSGIKFQTTSSGNGIFASTSGTVAITGLCEFGACANAQMNAQTQGQIKISANLNITGSAQYHYAMLYGGFVRTPGITTTLTGTPNFSQSFAFVYGLSLLYAGGNTFTGAATGQRYNGQLNSVIETSGGGATFFPGDVAGAVSTGAVYN